jgi:hypothetical protein
MLDKLNAVWAFAASAWVHEMPAVIMSTATLCTIAAYCQQYVWTDAVTALQFCRRHTSHASKQQLS